MKIWHEQYQGWWQNKIPLIFIDVIEKRKMMTEQIETFPLLNPIQRRYFLLSFSFTWKIFHILVNYSWHFKCFLWKSFNCSTVNIDKCERAILFMKSSTLMGFCQTQTWNGTFIASTQIFINAKPGVKRTALTETERERDRERARYTMSTRWSIDFVQIEWEENTPFLLLNIKWGIKCLRRAALNDRSNQLNRVHVRMYLGFVLCYFYNNFCREIHLFRKKIISYDFFIASCVIWFFFYTFSA